MKLKLQLKAAMPTFDTTPAARPLNLHGTTEKKGTRVMGVGEIGEPGGGGGAVHTVVSCLYKQWTMQDLYTRCTQHSAPGKRKHGGFSQLEQLDCFSRLCPYS